MQLSTILIKTALRSDEGRFFALTAAHICICADAYVLPTFLSHSRPPRLHRYRSKCAHHHIHSRSAAILPHMFILTRIQTFAYIIRHMNICAYAHKQSRNIPIGRSEPHLRKSRAKDLSQDYLFRLPRTE